MTIDELKRKLRQLKKLEAKIRFGDSESSLRGQYIWNDYFSIRDENDHPVKYNIMKLLGMDHQRLKEVFDEYFCHVYFAYFRENGITSEGVYDTELLSILDLPPDSTINTIKSKFRELAKRYHPDHGGDSSKFIELVDAYRKLMGDK